MPALKLYQFEIYFIWMEDIVLHIEWTMRKTGILVHAILFEQNFIVL